MPDQRSPREAIVDNLVGNRFDVVVSAVSITPELQKKVDFVPYFDAGESLLVQKGNPHNLKTVADLAVPSPDSAVQRPPAARSSSVSASATSGLPS